MAFFRHRASRVLVAASSFYTVCLCTDESDVSEGDDDELCRTLGKDLFKVAQKLRKDSSSGRSDSSMLMYFLASVHAAQDAENCNERIKMEPAPDAFGIAALLNAAVVADAQANLPEIVPGSPAAAPVVIENQRTRPASSVPDGFLFKTTAEFESAAADHARDKDGVLPSDFGERKLEYGLDFVVGCALKNGIAWTVPLKVRWVSLITDKWDKMFTRSQRATFEFVYSNWQRLPPGAQTKWEDFYMQNSDKVRRSLLQEESPRGVQLPQKRKSSSTDPPLPRTKRRPRSPIGLYPRAAVSRVHSPAAKIPTRFSVPPVHNLITSAAAGPPSGRPHHQMPTKVPAAAPSSTRGVGAIPVHFKVPPHPFAGLHSHGH